MNSYNKNSFSYNMPPADLSLIFINTINIKDFKMPHYLYGIQSKNRLPPQTASYLYKEIN